MDAVNDPSTNEVWVMKSAQVGWALALDTPIPTPSGWSSMGALRVGDEVFDERGMPCRVVFATPVMLNHACFVVTFSDGEQIVADGEHRWFVQSDHKIPAEFRTVRRNRTEGVLTTSQLRNMGVTYQRDGVTRNRFAVPLTRPLVLPDAELPISPYALGAWLGDGHSYSSQLTMHETDIEVASRIEKDGYRAEIVERKDSGVLTVAIRHSDHRRGGRGGRCDFTRTLRALGVLKNKHIPQSYLRSSFAQRLALLQGLMDTDGAITERGRAEYCSTSFDLACGVAELLSSLGIKFTVARSANHAIVRGKKKRSADRYRLSFLPYSDTQVFSLERKRTRQRARGGSSRESQTGRRRIVSICPTESVPVRCIQVSSDSRLYLAGRGMVPTHNTEIINNVVGYYVDQDPAPMLLIQPTVEMGEAWSKDRLAPMIRDSPRIAAKIADTKAKDSGNTILHKTFLGGHITIAGANSPAGLASRPVRVVLFDEVDRYPVSAGAEGDPVSLARKRTTTFWNRKLLAGSTPTIKGKSRIEAGFLQGDQRRYHVPCPHCDKPQVLKWSNVQWPDGKPEEAYYVCEHCGAVIVDADKPWMLAEADRRQRAGVQGYGWVPTAQPRRSGIASFHINEIYSPWVQFGAMAANFIEAKQFPDTLRTWINTALGEPDDVRGESMDETGLLERREVYPAEVPAGVALLTCGVDVQDNRLELEVVGWGPGGESWNIDYRVIEGDPGQHPSHSPLWKQLDDILLAQYEHESGLRMRISAVAIDTGGHKTDMVYAFCKPRWNRRVFAIKGVGGHGRPLVSRPTRNNAAGVRLFAVGVDTAKELIMSRLKVNDPGPGYSHFPAERDVAFFSQLTAERLVTRYFKGTAVRRWELKDPKARNEALDCRVYATAALAILDVNLDRVAKKLRQRIENSGARDEAVIDRPAEKGQATEPATSATPPAKPARTTKPPRPRGGFVHGWKR